MDSFLEAVSSSYFRSFIHALLLQVFFFCFFFIVPVPAIYKNVPHWSNFCWLPSRNLLAPRLKSGRYKGSLFLSVLYNPYRLRLTLCAIYVWCPGILVEYNKSSASLLTVYTLSCLLAPSASFHTFSFTAGTNNIFILKDIKGKKNICNWNIEVA
jgi:hypothetical protein